MMRWLKDKKRERRSNSASYDDEGKEDDYGFEKERTRAASKSPSTRRQLPPTPATPEEKSPHIYEEIHDMSCTMSPPPQPHANTESHRKKITSFGKKTSSGVKITKDGGSNLGIGGVGKGGSGNKYTSDVSASLLSAGGGGSSAKKSKFDDSEVNGQYVGEDTSPNLHRNGTPEVHCDVIIKDTHCEILLSRKPKSSGAVGNGRTDALSGYPSGNVRTSSTGGESFPSSWSQQSDMYVGPQSGRFNGQHSSRDRRASVDVHSSARFTSAFSLASTSSSAAPMMSGVGGASASSAGAQNSGSASFSSSTSRLNSIGASTSFSVSNFAEPFHPKSVGCSSVIPQKQRNQQEGHVYEHMQAIQRIPGADAINDCAGESAGSMTSSTKGVETYTTASNFIARPTIVPFKPLPGAKDPCVEAFGRPLSTGSSSIDGAYASIQDEAVGDSAYQTAPLKNCPSQSGANSVTYASIQDADDNTEGVDGLPSRGQVAYASIQDDQHLALLTNQNSGYVIDPHHRLFYGANPHNATNDFQQKLSRKSKGFSQGPARSRILHRRSPSDSSSCTYASVSFPTEPKHYNTISDLGDGLLLPDDRRRSFGSSSFFGGRYGKQQQQIPPSETIGCLSDASDGIYSGVEPYRAKPDCLSQSIVGKARAFGKEVKISPQKQDIGAKLKNHPSFAQQQVYVGTSAEHDTGNRSNLYASIESPVTDIDAVLGSSKPLIHNRNTNSQMNATSFLNPGNDLRRFAVDRNSFHIDFCTCSDDHSSSCGFGDLTSAKTVDDYTTMNFRNGNRDKKCKDQAVIGGGRGGDDGGFPGVSSKGDHARSDTTAAPSSCKDCGRLIKQITYSESYSDETYEHAYSSRLLTRKGRRYSSPDITFSEISNSEFNADPPSYLQYRSSPSWSRRSPAVHDVRMSRDDTWASSPRSDDVIPPAYGALDDNGFVSGGYERWSPTYARNRDKDITRSQTDSLTSGQEKIRPWMSSASAFPEGLLDENMADDVKANLCSGGDMRAGSAFFTPNSNEQLDMYSLEKENTEPKSKYLLRKDLEAILPEARSTISQDLKNEATIIHSNSQCARLVKKDKSQMALLPIPAETKVNVTTSDPTSAVEEVETRDKIPDRNTKKLANYFQSLSTTSKEALVGSEDNVLVVHSDEPDNGSKGPKPMASHLKSSAFTKLPTHSSSFCAPKMADQKKSLLVYSEGTSLGSQSSPDVCKSRHRREADSKTGVTSLVLNMKTDFTDISANIDKNESFTRPNSNDRVGNKLADNAIVSKPQNKTDSGDTCYEFDISTSSEGEQQSSCDHLLSKVGISLDLEQEVQHIADARAAARKKRLLCRQCKKRGAANTSVYSIIDDTACEKDTAVATGNRDLTERKGLKPMVDEDFGFMLEDDGMCPHLSLKFGELRAMLDNMFVDQRAAILDCMTDQSATPNPYSFKAGGKGGLLLCGQDLASLPAALQHLCRECGCEVMTSDSESVTTVYSGSLQAGQSGAQLRMTSPGSGPPQTPSCDSDEGTMADNSGDDDDDVPADEEHRTKILKKSSPLSCCQIESKHSSNRRNSSPLDLAKVNKQHSHHRVSGSSGSHQSINYKSNNNNNNNSNNNDLDDANNSSGYDEPDDNPRHHQHSAPRHERTAHRTRKKEKRDRKSSACSNNHIPSCTCCVEKSPRKVSSRNSASSCATKSSHYSGGGGADSSNHVLPIQKASKDAQSWVNSVQMRKACLKKHSGTSQCNCTSPYCPKHGGHRHSHSHADQYQERGCSSGDQAICKEDETITYHQQDSNSISSNSTTASPVSEKALKDIYSPLPAKALCLLTSRNNNKTNNNDNSSNSYNNNEGIININNNSVISSNSSSSSGSNASSSNLLANNTPLSCTCGKSVTLEESLDPESENQSSMYSSPPSVNPPLLPAALKVKAESAEVEAETKDPSRAGCPTSRENDSDKGHGTGQNGSNERASEKTSHDDNADNNNVSVKTGRDEEASGRPTDNGVIKTETRVTTVQTHLAREKSENKAQFCMNAASLAKLNVVAGDGGCVDCCNGSRLPGCELVMGEKCAELLCSRGEVVPPTTCCCCGSSRGCRCRVELSQQHHHYRHHRSRVCASLCSSGSNKGPQPCVSHKDSNSLGPTETSSSIPSLPSSQPATHKSCLGFPVSRGNNEKHSSVDLLRDNTNFKRGDQLEEENLPRCESKELEHKHRSSKPRDPSNNNANDTRSEEQGVNKRRENSAAELAKSGKEGGAGKVDIKMAGIATPTMVADARQREIIRNPSSLKPPPKARTTGEQTLDSSPQGATVKSETGQFENPCSSEQQGEKASRGNGDAPCSDMQIRSSEIPSLSSGVSSFCHGDTGNCAVAPSPCSTPISPSVKAKLLIPRKHKLELATLDLLPETALGGDMHETEIDSTAENSHQAAVVSASAPSLTPKPKPRERAAKTNVVQKMAKMFEEQVCNKPIGNNNEIYNKKGGLNVNSSTSSSASPRVQRASDGKATLAACASAATNARNPAVKNNDTAYLMPAASLSLLVSSVQSSPDEPAHQCTGETKRPQALSNEKLVQQTKTECIKSSVRGPGAKSINQARSEETSKEMRLRVGVTDTKSDETTERCVEKIVCNTDETHKPRGSKMKHSDLLQRLKNAKGSRIGGESPYVCQGDSSSASSSPSSTKKATVCTATAFNESENQSLSHANTAGPAGVLNQHAGGKQKRYSKKPYHKRRSKSRSARRRSGSRAGLEKEERTYYYFSSDLSDIDVMEVDDWETYASAMTVNKQSETDGHRSQRRSRVGKLNVEEQQVAPSRAKKELPSGESSTSDGSPLKTKKKAEPNLAADVKTKSRISRELRDSEYSGAISKSKSSKAMLRTSDEIQSTGEDEEDGNVARDDEGLYSRVSPITTSTANDAAAVTTASASSSPMGSPELPKPRRSRRSACAEGTGSGKTNQLEVYKTRRSSNANKLLSELIVRNYDMQIYGNV